MSDDIVARLRDLKNAMNECGFTGISAVTNAAADEIERLRKELAACCRSAAPGPHTTGGGDPSAAEELEAWRAAFRREDEFDGRCE